MPEFYQNYDINQPSVNSKYLARDHSNFLTRELQLPAGTSDVPGWSFRGDEKTGGFWESEGVIGLSSLGWRMFLFTNNAFSFVNRFGKKLTLSTEALTSDIEIVFPAVSGTVQLVETPVVITKTNLEASATIYPGMTVRLYSPTGCKLANATSDTTFAACLATNTANAGDLSSLQFEGVVYLADWSTPTGGALLSTGVYYYLSDSVSGGLTSTPPANPQIIGIAISTTEMLIKIS